MIPAAAQQVNGGTRRATWFEDFGRYVNTRKCATFGMDTPNVGPDSPTVLTLLVDFAEPGLPARTQRQLGRAEILSTSFTDNEHRIRTLYDARHSYELAWAIIAIAGVAGAAAIYAVPSSQLRNSPKTLP